MVSWSEGSSSSSDGYSVTSEAPAPATIFCSEWRGLAPDLAARCEHQCVCEKFVSFESVDSGRRYLACAQKEIPKCNFVEWIDPEWPATLKMSLARVWGMYEDENKLRLRENVVNAEENFRVVKEKEKMEKDLRFFKLDFAKMVADKEQAITELGNARIAFSDLEQELEKKKLSDKSSTSIHQVLRAKAEKERDEMKQQMDNMKEEMDKVVSQRDELKKEKKKLEYMIGDLFKHKEDTKSKIRRVKEIFDEFE
ncbi:unnamed protein product [Triticum turgidum subsp. durum]|uniref:Zinc finger GRF-type domain-containing protein n=1 Tax=Triticum turgidum subsp. durum TaxID=4567 RepID=A0A9R0XKP7_TRITD|nr:unnamed protein product [Triticum turgidum subsp. durum]